MRANTKRIRRETIRVIEIEQVGVSFEIQVRDRRVPDVDRMRIAVEIRQRIRRVLAENPVDVPDVRIADDKIVTGIEFH